MLARKTLEQRYLEWNRQWGAPFGTEPGRIGRILSRVFHTPLPQSGREGIFGLQPNNDTRVFEYPWAFFFPGLAPGMKVLEIGGGLSGFQFVLDKSGMEVVNVDPGMESQGWPVSLETMERLNRAFGTRVTLINDRIENASVPQGVFDRVFSISALEHFSRESLPAAMDKVYAALKPGGLFILTVDLFLDLEPFSRKQENGYGRNVSIMELIDESKFELIHGNKRELYGFADFDQRNILGELPELLIGRSHPVLVQTVVLKRRQLYSCK